MGISSQVSSCSQRCKSLSRYETEGEINKISSAYNKIQHQVAKTVYQGRPEKNANKNGDNTESCWLEILLTIHYSLETTITIWNQVLYLISFLSLLTKATLATHQCVMLPSTGTGKKTTWDDVSYRRHTGLRCRSSSDIATDTYTDRRGSRRTVGHRSVHVAPLNLSRRRNHYLSDIDLPRPSPSSSPSSQRSTITPVLWTSSYIVSWSHGAALRRRGRVSLWVTWARVAW